MTAVSRAMVNLPLFGAGAYADDPPAGPRGLVGTGVIVVFPAAVPTPVAS